jgi:hypothetical protein
MEERVRGEEIAHCGPALFSIWRRLQCHLAAGIGFGARHLTSQQTPKLPTSGRD